MMKVNASLWRALLSQSLSIRSLYVTVDDSLLSINSNAVSMKIQDSGPDLPTLSSFGSLSTSRIQHLCQKGNISVPEAEHNIVKVAEPHMSAPPKALQGDHRKSDAYAAHTEQ